MIAFESAWNWVALASGVPVDWHNEGRISCMHSRRIHLTILSFADLSQPKSS